jgi:hypothetical protein
MTRRVHGDTVRCFAYAANVTFDATETGWQLRVESDEGDDVFVFNIHHLALELAKHADETLGAWRREAEATMPFRCQPDESCGYADDDPKQPNYHDVRADIYDGREGK